MDVLIEFVCKHQKIIEDYELEKYIMNSICVHEEDKKNSSGSGTMIKSFLVNLFSKKK
jgi:hypothetical protein